MNVQQIFCFLKEIESGIIVITPTRAPADVYAGDVLYNASNGWQISIFNDANSWDYIARIVTDLGEVYVFDDFDGIPALREYEPPIQVIRDIYKIPQSTLEE